MSRKESSGRGGLLDLLLVCLVVLAAWTRTPVGQLGEWGIALARGVETERPHLIDRFVTGPTPKIVARIDVALPRPTEDLPEGSFPEPYRSAASLVLPDAIPAASEALLQRVPEGDTPRLAVLDQLHLGNPEFTLEIYAIGHDLRHRAVSRARAAGESDPESYAVHRRYLPVDAAKIADEIVTGTMGTAAMLSLAWPIAEPHRISSSYGYRMHPVLKKKKLHNGTDMAVPIGTPVLATQSGEVSVASKDDLNGNYVVIEHGHGVRSSYCHLDELGVKKGEELERAQVIGLSGNTGRSTGPHLHFTLRVAGKTVDPERFRPPEPEAS